MREITLTSKAIDKVKAWLEGQVKARALRIYIVGGGCSGFQYGFDVDGERASDDYEFSVEDFLVWVDPLSFQYLVGSEIDFVQDLKGARFVVNNPHAKSTCGCGASFSLNFDSV